MKIISAGTLRAYWEGNPLSEQPLRAWHDEARKAQWNTPQDIKDLYRNASFLGDNRVVFNIKGNDYRLVTAVAYKVGVVYIKFIGTHAEYDAIDALTVEIKP